MRNMLFVFIFSVCISAACHEPKPTTAPKELTPEEQTLQNIDALKNVAKNGDLVVRLTDDIISNQVAYLNEKDKSFSHCGMIAEQDGKKFVCHIAPELAGADTIQFIPIDSFLNPDKNIKCALYRYNFSQIEKDSMYAYILQAKSRGARFDRSYNFDTDEKLYCSEMIAKAIKAATAGRVVCKGFLIPQKMQKIVMAYFKNEKDIKNRINKQTYISLDNLYLIPECKQMMSFPLKHFPGQ